MFERTIHPYVLEFLKEKIVLLAGPRQVGKTFFSKKLFSDSIYLNFDSSTDRKFIRTQEWDRRTPLLILDEIHKMKNWKSYLKGIYDKEGVTPPILVTGSARMDTYKKGGDSLAGRHFPMRLMPLSVKEVARDNAQEVFDLLLRFGGFPEPFLKGNDRSANLWRKGHLQVILREDMLDLEKVRDVKSIEILVDLLADSVGSNISLSSLARTLEVSPNTVKHWIQVLESLYVIFSVRPFNARPGKSILKEPKIYFYDTGRVTAGDGPRLENLVACHLLKRMHFLQDCQGDDRSLYYLRDKENREIDFATTVGKKIEWLIEVKSADSAFSKQLHYYQNRLKPKRACQLVHKIDRERSTPDGLESLSAAEFMASLET